MKYNSKEANAINQKLFVEKSRIEKYIILNRMKMPR